jgi:hypothetical protein
VCWCRSLRLVLCSLVRNMHLASRWRKELRPNHSKFKSEIAYDMCFHQSCLIFAPVHGGGCWRTFDCLKFLPKCKLAYLSPVCGLVALFKCHFHMIKHTSRAFVYSRAFTTHVSIALAIFAIQMLFGFVAGHTLPGRYWVHRASSSSSSEAFDNDRIYSRKRCFPLTASFCQPV